VQTRTRSSTLPLAALIVAVQGLAVLALGFALLVNSVVGNPDSLVGAIFIGVLAAMGGAGLLLCAWGLRRRRRWSRSPALVWQLLMIPVGWYQVQGGLRWLGLSLVGVSALGALLLLVPATTQALQD
jgi:peptidoglycan/LPS O-acetylase OafA/YrhL